MLVNINKHQLFTNIFLFVLIIDILVYQSNWQISNYFFIAFNILLFVFYLISIMEYKYDLYLVLLFTFMIIYSLFTFNATNSILINRIIINDATYLLFFLAYIFGYFTQDKVRLNNHRKIFSFFLFWIFIGAVIIDYRDILPNPNWIALMLYYSFILLEIVYKDELNISGILLKLTLFFFLFFFNLESRGSSIMVLSLIIFILSGKYIIKVFEKNLYLIFIIVGIFLLNFSISSLLHDPEFQQIVNSISKRGLGGREGPLFFAYEKLFINGGEGFWGYGPWIQGSIGDGVKTVHIHFSFYEITLKYSIFFFIGLILFFNSIWKKANSISSQKLKIIIYGVILSLSLTIFFYNGYGPSHFGINIFNFFLLGQINKKIKGNLINE